MGQPEWDRQNKTTRTELTEQDCQHRIAKIRQPRQADLFSLNGTVRKGHPRQGKQTGETEQDFWHITVRTVLLGQDVYSRSDKRGQLGT